MRLLLIEDDLDLAASVGEFLEAKGHEAEYAYDGESGLGLLGSRPVDVVVLDLNLPGIDGIEVCRRIRSGANPCVPVLMLTARDQVADKVRGFEAGADDYLVKPFALAELLVRVHALHRRASGHAKTILRVGGLELDRAESRVTRDARPIELNRIGEIFLATLMEASPRVVSREELEEAIWGARTPDRDLLRSHLYLLRQAVDKPFEDKMIHTIHGRGYKLVAPQVAEPGSEPGSESGSEAG